MQRIYRNNKIRIFLCEKFPVITKFAFFMQRISRNNKIRIVYAKNFPY